MRVLALAALLTLPAMAGASETTWAVVIDHATYDPRVLVIAPGDTVVWTNLDAMPIRHSVTDVLGTFDSGLDTGPWTFSHTFPDEGVVAYHCRMHESMVGLIIVKA